MLTGEIRGRRAPRHVTRLMVALTAPHPDDVIRAPACGTAGSLDHLTEHGAMPAERLRESPFTDYSAAGVDGVFPEPEVRALLATLDEVRRRAVA